MDLPKIKSVVLNQLTNTNGLYSLKLQNHIYGCFIVMEDIAQHTIDISGTTLSTPKFTFDYDKQFNEIGLRYGFAMDTKLTLDIFTPEYKATWLQYFKDIDIAQDINEVDAGKGWTALHYAVNYGQKHLVEYLIVKGADVNKKD